MHQHDDKEQVYYVTEREGVVVTGMLGQDGVFQASEVLAKHDENYMPPEVSEALKKSEAARANAATAGEYKGS